MNRPHRLEYHETEAMYDSLIENEEKLQDLEDEGKISSSYLQGFRYALGIIEERSKLFRHRRRVGSLMDVIDELSDEDRQLLIDRLVE